MITLDRRDFLKLAAALGATLAWGCSTVHPSSSGWRGACAVTRTRPTTW